MHSFNEHSQNVLVLVKELNIITNAEYNGQVFEHCRFYQSNSRKASADNCSLSSALTISNMKFTLFIAACTSDTIFLGLFQLFGRNTLSPLIKCSAPNFLK